MKGTRLVGQSEEHYKLIRILDKIASTDAEVLITGQSGVGKELYVKYLHEKSRRSSRRLVTINCATLNGELLENELFGHVSGAFTGAHVSKDGLIAEAEGGTLFLDEVQSLGSTNQMKLLRFLQEKEYRRLGESKVRYADVRIIAATNTDLRTAVTKGSFREDLLFRLRVIPIEVPPLRSRQEDIILLCEHFIQYYSELYQVPSITLSKEASQLMQSYEWPGNVRELENCICYLSCLQPQGPVLAKDLLTFLSCSAKELPEANASISSKAFNDAKREVIQEFELVYISQALRRTGGNIAKAARESGKPRRAFFELMRKYKLTASEFRPTFISIE
jgi:DNA-binding NtrC family response regulator